MWQMLVAPPLQWMLLIFGAGHVLGEAGFSLSRCCQAQHGFLG